MKHSVLLNCKQNTGNVKEHVVIKNSYTVCVHLFYVLNFNLN